MLSSLVCKTSSARWPTTLSHVDVDSGAYCPYACPAEQQGWLIRAEATASAIAFRLGSVVVARLPPSSSSLPQPDDDTPEP
eukprot:4197013-Pyramimonas_sp.AAC.1